MFGFINLTCLILKPNNAGLINSLILNAVMLNALA
jgi:hypothetical protein